MYIDLYVFNLKCIDVHRSLCVQLEMYAWMKYL